MVGGEQQTDQTKEWHFFAYIVVGAEAKKDPVRFKELCPVPAGRSTSDKTNFPSRQENNSLLADNHRALFYARSSTHQFTAF